MNINESIKMIEELSNANGVSGFEDEVIEIGRKYASDVCNIEEDSMRNLYLKRKNNTEDKPVVLLDAHSDELGFIVQWHNPNGTLKILKLGSWVKGAVEGHKVRVRNSDGKYIPGVVCTKPPHFLTEEQNSKPTPISEWAVDVGASSIDELINDFKIEVGAPVVPEVQFELINTSNTMMGKAFDNRLGCSVIIDVMKELKNENLQVDVIGAFSSQEEVGARGSQVSSRKIKSNISIVFEGSPSDDSVVKPHESQGTVHGGSQIRLFDSGMISNPRFAKFSKDIAKEKNIKHQVAVRSGGSTNARIIHTSNEGVPSIVLGVPVRYAHTHFGISGIDDYEATIKWAVEIIKSLNPEIIKSF